MVGFFVNITVFAPYFLMRFMRIQNFKLEKAFAYAIFAALFLLIILNTLEDTKALFSFDIKQGSLYVSHADSILRLHIVSNLYETGDWFNHHISRVQPPFGIDSPWTRPVDVLLLMGAIPLTIITHNFKDALFLWGAALPPLFMLLSILLILKLSKENEFRLPAISLLFFTLMLLPPLKGLYAAGNVDHHFLLNFLFIAYIRVYFLFLKNPAQHRYGVYAGLIIAMGGWVSIEFFLPIITTLIFLGILWVRDTAIYQQGLQKLLAGVAVGISTAVLIERADVAIVHDSISIVHVTLWSITACCFWVLGKIPTETLFKRLVCCVIAFAGIILIMQGLFPNFYSGPYAQISAEYKRDFLPRFIELTPFYQLVGVPFTIAYFSCFFIIIFYAITHLRRKKNALSVPFIAGMFLSFVCVVLSNIASRWAPYAITIMAITTAFSFSAWIKNAQSDKKIAQRLLTFLMIIIFIPLLSAGLVDNSFRESLSGNPLKDGAKPSSRCTLDLFNLLQKNNLPNIPNDVSKRLLIIHHYGSNVLFWTPHSLLTAGYHREFTAMMDYLKFFTTTDPAIAADVVKKDAVDYVVFCKEPLYPEPSFIFKTPPENLPDWLKVLPNAVEGLNVYEVVKERLPAGE